jgi:flagellar biosynthesis protein FliR
MMEAMIIACLLILFRVAAFVAFLPPTNGQGIPNTVKIGLSVALTMILAERHALEIALTLNQPVTAHGAWMRLAFLGIRETALGAGLAWLFSLCLVPVRIGGAWVAQEMGLTMGGLTSPMDQQSSNVVSQILEALAVMAFFLLDLHHFMFLTLGNSFTLKPAASNWSMPSWDAVVWSVSTSVDQGFMIVGPIGILLFVTSLTVLVTMRTAPQFNFMSYGMTLRLIAGLGGLIVFFPEMCGVVEQLLTFVGQEVTT